MDNYFLNLKLDLSDQAPSGVGWYIQQIIDGQLVHDKSLSISVEDAQIIEDAYNQILADVDYPGVKGRVASSKPLIYAKLQEELKFAEEQATKIGLLRQRINAVQPQQENE